MNSRLNLLALAAALLVTTGFSVNAAADNKEEEFAKCHENATSTMDMHDCMAKELVYYDAQLNSVYSALKNESSGSDADSKETLKRLVDAQRTWIKFRDANCSFESTSMLGGTGEGLIFHGCKVRMTKERARELSSQR